MPEVFVLSGPDVGRSFEVEDGATFGRSPECAVRLRDKSISRTHAVLEGGDEGWALVDLESRNGVFVADRRVERALLEDGGEVRLGDVLLRFRTVVAAAEAQARSTEAARPETELDLGDEIELDVDLDAELGAVLDQYAAAQPEFVPGGGAGRVARERPAGTPRASAQAPAAERGTPVAERGATGRVLQYHSVEDRPGFLGADLGQYPFAVRALVYLGLLALCAGLAWLAFRAVAFR